jgi:hypothetical protein
MLGVAGAVGLPFALYFSTKQGSYYNQYLGVTWELSALAALPWGATRADRSAAVVADVVVGLALAGAILGTAVGPDRYDFRQLRMPFASIPTDLRAVAKRGPLFDPVYTDLVPGEVYPEVYTVSDLLAGDEQPNMLIQALLHRRFEYAVTNATALGYLDPFCHPGSFDAARDPTGRSHCGRASAHFSSRGAPGRSGPGEDCGAARRAGA